MTFLCFFGCCLCNTIVGAKIVAIKGALQLFCSANMVENADVSLSKFAPDMVFSGTNKFVRNNIFVHVNLLA
jgi:hypothetical protein